VDAALVALVDRVTGRLRKAERVARTVTLRLRFQDFKRATRSHTLGEPTDRTDKVLAAARRLLDDARPLIEHRGITLVGVALTNLESSGAAQLPLDARAEVLDSTLDELRERFGDEAITRAVLLDRAENPRLPMLPD
jgi:DNA polymerase-4